MFSADVEDNSFDKVSAALTRQSSSVLLNQINTSLFNVNSIYSASTVSRICGDRPWSADSSFKNGIDSFNLQMDTSESQSNFDDDEYGMNYYDSNVTHPQNSCTGASNALEETVSVTPRDLHVKQVLYGNNLLANPGSSSQQREEIHNNSNGMEDFISISEIESLYDYVSESLQNGNYDNSTVLTQERDEDDRRDQLLTPADFSLGIDDVDDLYDSIASNFFKEELMLHSESIPEVESVFQIGIPDKGLARAHRSPSVETYENYAFTKHDQYVLESTRQFNKIKAQAEIFYMRIKMARIASLSSNPEQQNKPSKLESHMESIISRTSLCSFIESISRLNNDLEFDMSLGSVFLSHFISYIHSTLDAESFLIGINDFLVYFLPSVEIVLEKKLETQIREDIIKEGILPALLESLTRHTNKEIKYSNSTVDGIIKYKQKSTLKAHIVRMLPTESQKLFQETFSDSGNLADLYLIYIWRILKLYDMDETCTEPSVLCLSDTLKESGEFLDTVPEKDLKVKEVRSPLIQIKDTSPSSEGNKKESAQSLTEMSFEWADFRVGQVYENGVLFLTNMTEWVKRLQEISILIERLEVKKYVKFVPALGTTYGLHMQDGLQLLTQKEQVSFIRVRVVRVAGPVSRVYGIDTGSVFMSDIAQLFLLPATLLNFPPCGRLAHLPIVPAPDASALAPSLKLLVSLARHAFLAQDLSLVNPRTLTVWIQVDQLTYTTLQLFDIMVKIAPDSSLIPDMCQLITDYLIRVTSKQTEAKACIEKSLDILIRAMKTSDEIRLLLAKQGTFITLCDYGLRSGEQDVWNTIRMLLGGKDAMESLLSVSRKMLRMQNSRNKQPWKIRSTSLELFDNQNEGDKSPSILQIAAMPTLDRNWDLEVRNTIHCRQLVTHRDPCDWKWHREEVLKADDTELHYGHKIDVQNDETHHIILDKSVPNIRMNTLLQIILGMLNTGLGGKIYIGLSHLGIVQGVRVTRDQRDCFMLGFSKLVTSEIFPMVLPCDALIQFIPVIRSSLLPLSAQASGGIEPISETSFIVILTVQPQPNTIYRYRNDNEQIFMREGGATTSIKGHRLAHFNTTLSNRTQQFQQQVAKEKLAMFNLIFSR